MAVQPRLFDGVLLLVAIAAILLAGLSYARGPAFGDTDAGFTTGTELLGRELPPVAALPWEGGADDPISFQGDGPVLTLIFTSTCSYCEANASRWRGLVRALPPGTRVLAVNLESPAIAESWLSRHGMDAVSRAVPSNPGELSALWGIHWVPLTLVVEPDGRVAYARYGVLEDPHLREITELFESVRATEELRG